MNNNMANIFSQVLLTPVNNMPNCADLLFELLKNKPVLYIANNLFIHQGTIKRWLENSFVPKNYYNDLNKLLNYKYPVPKEYRDQDQFYTKKPVSKKCYLKALNVLSSLDFKIDDYTFIEPSAGCCNFYELLPKHKRVGVDTQPKGDKDLIKCDYLDFYPKTVKNIVIGNPPFGLRGNLALRFINHSYKFADAVCFILPQLFNSDGKGVAKTRVKGYKLAYTEELPLNSFEYPNKKDVKIATVFQVWIKINTHLLKPEIKQTCNTFFKVYSLSNGGTPSSTRNKKMIGFCDVYLPSTTFKKVRCSRRYEDLPHNRGYGIKFLKQEKQLLNAFMSIDWNKASFLSTNSALNLRTSIIVQELTRKGFKDE